MDALLRHASETYAFVYFGLIIALALIEGVVPRRRAGDMLGRRWIGNFGATIIGVAATRLVFPIASAEWALVCRSHGWGLFNHGAFPTWMSYGATILVIDL